MVRFRALKFVLLSLRQLTKPCVQSIISRASHERPLTRHVCTSLGRFSLALSAVTAEWGRREEANRIDSLENAEERTNGKSTSTFKNKESEPSTSSDTSTKTKSKTKTETSTSSSESQKQTMETHSNQNVGFNEDLLQFMRDALGNNYNKQIDDIAREAGMQMNSKHTSTSTRTQEINSKGMNLARDKGEKQETEKEQKATEVKETEINYRNSQVMSAPHETSNANKGTSKRYSS